MCATGYRVLWKYPRKIFFPKALHIKVKIKIPVHFKAPSCLYVHTFILN
jgi:hypothetical protein